MDTTAAEPASSDASLRRRVGMSLSAVLFLTLNVVAVGAAAAQMLIDASSPNVVAALLVLLAVLSTTAYLQRSAAFDDTPISSLAVLGLCVTTQWTSLMSQTFSGAALVEGLRVPLWTFSMLTTVQGLALLAHWIYRRFSPLRATRTALTESVCVPLGVMRAPSPTAVWVLALIGAASIAAGAAETGNAGGKIVQALEPFAWLPAIIPILYARHGAAYCRIGKHVTPLLLYALLLVAIGLSRNARTLMVIGPVQLLLVLLMYGLRDHRPASRRMLFALVCGAALSAVFVSVGRDIATAMVVVRGQKDVLNPIEMIQETFDALGDRGKLEIYRGDERASAGFEAYDEVYLDNPFMARFSETKFHDNMLQILQHLGPEEREAVAEMSWIKIIAVMPQPLLDYFGLGIDKDRYEFSMGDFYRSLTEREDFLGGAATGSIWVDMLTIFDWWAPLATMLLAFVVYVMLDMLARNDKHGALDISPLVVCSAWAFFIYGLGAESLMAKVGYLLRDFPQRLLLYALAMAVLSWLFPWRPLRTDTPSSAQGVPPGWHRSTKAGNP